MGVWAAVDRIQYHPGIFGAQIDEADLLGQHRESLSSGCESTEFAQDQVFSVAVDLQCSVPASARCAYLSSTRLRPKQRAHDFTDLQGNTLERGKPLLV